MISGEEKSLFLVTKRRNLFDYCLSAAENIFKVRLFSSVSGMDQMMHDLPAADVSFVVIDFEAVKTLAELKDFFRLNHLLILNRKLALIHGGQGDLLKILNNLSIPVFQFPCKKDFFKKHFLAELVKKTSSVCSKIKNQKEQLRLIAGISEEISVIRNKISVFADSGLSFLLQGEPGTGKTFLAERIHSISPRKNGPFVRVNMSKLTPGTAAAELFGCVTGAYTGAVQRQGYFEAANGGILFLDEISETNIEVQPMLLEAIQNKRGTKTGSVKEAFYDVQIVFATNEDLPSLVRSGKFRRDLYARITNGVVITVPSLKNRKEDIPVLAKNILMESQFRFLKFAEETLDFLREQSWPENVRQLEGAVKLAAHLCNSLENSVILPEHFF